MALYLETLVRSVQNQTNNFTRHTGFICVLTLIALTILQGWMVTLPWETDDSSLIGVSIGLSEVGCLIGESSQQFNPLNNFTPPPRLWYQQPPELNSLNNPLPPSSLVSTKDSYPLTKDCKKSPEFLKENLT